jgi:hypothetical protein
MNRCACRGRLIDRHETVCDPPLRAGPRHSRYFDDAPDEHLIQTQSRVAPIGPELDNQEGRL